MGNLDRIEFCLRLWRKELLEDIKNGDNDSAIQWVIATLDNEILNGEYCSDEEWNEFLISGNILYVENTYFLLANVHSVLGNGSLEIPCWCI